MFNKDFYPTPAEVIHQMLYGFDAAGKVILEPSAGKGDIVKELQAAGAKEVIACELNADLRKIAATHCRIIANDFLTVTADAISHIDAIIMNPPFSNEERHIMHAFSLAPAGCVIISLCNYSCYRDAWSGTRRELKHTINEYGSIINLGNCFADAERTTDVEVGLIRIAKPGKKAGNEFEGFFTDEEIGEQGDGIMTYNFIRDLVNRYVGAVKIFDEQLAAGEKMNTLTASFFTSQLSFSCTYEKMPVLRDSFKKDLQKSGWMYVFDKMNMNKYATRGLREDINKFVEQQTNIPFTMRNIYKMIEVVIGTTESRMDRAIEEVFDNLTRHTHENRYNVEGWKTNDCYLFNRKFIMPGVCYQSRWASNNKIDFSDHGRDTMSDLLKALCYITATNFDTIEGLYSVGRDRVYGEKFDYAFFTVRCYKKGTSHFEFKDEAVWATLNQRIAKIKGYVLPEKIKSRKAA